MRKPSPHEGYIPNTDKVDIYRDVTLAHIYSQFQRKVVTYPIGCDAVLERPANADVHRVWIDVGAQAIQTEAGTAREFEFETQA